MSSPKQTHRICTVTFENDSSVTVAIEESKVVDGLRISKSYAEYLADAGTLTGGEVGAIRRGGIKRFELGAYVIVQHFNHPKDEA